MGRAIELPAPARRIASLSPRLLARKGGARPAMRSPLAMLDDAAGDDLGWQDDLGWNDMGEADFAPPARVVSFPREAAPRPPRRARGAALQEGGKAAFTLRLDAERHQRLRQACSQGARSAQALVTEAVDRLLAEIAEIEALAGEAFAPAAKRRQS